MRVLETIKKYNLINEGQKVAVATSGGSDSMALLHFLIRNKKTLGIKILCLNIDHQIRGEDSKKDSLFVKEYCQKNKIEFLGFVVDVLKFKKENSFTIEQAARILRYQKFQKVLDEKFADIVATAHNLPDLTETLLLNLFRGSGLNGMAGNFKRGKIIRPLMETPKEEILEYLEKNNVPHIEDLSNLDEQYTRNYLRQSVIPKIKEKFPNLEQVLLRFSENCKEDLEYLEFLAGKYVEGESIKLDKGIPKSLLSYAIFSALNNMDIYADIESSHIDKIKDLYYNLQTGSEICLKNDIFCVKEYDKIVFCKRRQKIQITKKFRLGNFKIDRYLITIEKTTKFEKAENVFYLKDGIEKFAVIRFKQENDFFKRFGGGTKSLSDYFTDIKLEKLKRSFVPLIANGSEIIAVLPFNISENYKVENFNGPFYKITIKEKET